MRKLSPFFFALALCAFLFSSSAHASLKAVSSTSSGGGGGGSLAVTATTGNANFQPLFSTGTGAAVTTIYVDPTSPLTYNPSTGLLSTLGVTTTSLTDNGNASLLGTTTLSSVQILGGVINGTTLGSTTSSTAIFTTTSTATANASTLLLNGAEVPLPPGGRLSLSSTNPVMLANTTSATTIYYLPYVSQNVPIYNGTHWQEYDIGSSGLSLAMTTTANFPTTKVYDIYATTTGGSPVICAMYWGSNTLRSTTSGGAGGNQDASITQKNGIWTNHASIAANECYNNNTAYTPSANQATLLGSFYTTAAGQTTWNCQVTASGGVGVTIGISNANNRVPVSCMNQDTQLARTTTNTAAYTAYNGSALDSAAYVDTLQQAAPSLSMYAQGANGTIGDSCQLGICQNCNNGVTSNMLALTYAPTGTLANNYQVLSGTWSQLPLLGYNYYQLVWAAGGGGTCTMNPSAGAVTITIGAAY